MNDDLDHIFEFINQLFQGTFKVERIKVSKVGTTVISTVKASDRGKYETAIVHLDFNHGNPIVVGVSASKEKILKLHDEWVKKLTENKIDSIYNYDLGIFHLRDTKGE